MNNNNNNNNNNNCIYELVDKNNVPFYVGKTSNINQRIKQHLKDVNNIKNTSYKCNKIRKLMKEYNYRITYNILFQNLTYDEANDLEIYVISLYRENNIILTNISNGGEGLPGYLFTDEHKNKLKESRKKLFNSGYKVYNKDKKFNDIFNTDKEKEIKQKISDGVKNSLSYRKSNKNKKLEDIVGTTKAQELKQLSSERAYNTFKNTKQSSEHILKRSIKQSNTKQNWDINMKKKISEINKINGSKSIINKRKNIKVILPNNIEFIVNMVYTEISYKLKEDYNIICNPQSISKIINNNLNYLNTKHKCNFILL